MQRQRDLAAGLNTAGYITGYRGSPLGTYDQQLERAKALSTRTTSCTSRASTRTSRPPPARARSRSGLDGESRYDGVFAIWYAKGPGVDRSGDAIRHGNLFGTAPARRRAAAAGRRPYLRDLSTTAHQSEYAMVDAHGAGAEPGRRAGDPGIRPARHRHVALHRAAGWRSNACTTRSRARPRSRSTRPARRSSCPTTSRRRRVA